MKSGVRRGDANDVDDLQIGRPLWLPLGRRRAGGRTWRTVAEAPLPDRPWITKGWRQARR